MDLIKTVVAFMNTPLTVAQLVGKGWALAAFIAVGMLCILMGVVVGSKHCLGHGTFLFLAGIVHTAAAIVAYLQFRQLAVHPDSPTTEWMSVYRDATSIFTTVAIIAGAAAVYVLFAGLALLRRSLAVAFMVIGCSLHMALQAWLLFVGVADTHSLERGINAVHGIPAGWLIACASLSMLAGLIALLIGPRRDRQDTATV